MKRIFSVAMVVELCLGLAAAALAGDGQHHGDRGQGAVVQHENRRVP